MKGKLNKFKLVGLDTNIFSYHFHNHPEFVQSTDVIFKELSEDNLKAVTSLISIAELLSFSVPDQKIKQLQDAFYSTPNLTILDMTQDIALRAAEFRRKYKFKLADSIQLATAVCVKAKAFITNDNKLKSYKGLEVILLSEIR